MVLLNLKIETLEPNLKKYNIKAKLRRTEALQLCGGVLAYFLQGLGVNPQDKYENKIVNNSQALFL